MLHGVATTRGRAGTASPKANCSRWEKRIRVTFGHRRGGYVTVDFAVGNVFLDSALSL
jgi:hypothetical protein